jgi:hypothetical protein
MHKSISKERRTPSFSAGWCTSNAHEYKNNRYNQIGSYKPFLVEKDILTVSVDIRRRIAKLICNSVKLFNINDSESNQYTETDDDIRCGRIRYNMRKEFWQQLGMTDSPEDLELFPFFLSEGFSLISEFLIAFHKDVLNDSSPSHSMTYSLKASILLTPEMMLPDNPISNLSTALGLSAGDVLPISLMIYSRKSVSDYCVKQSKISKCLRGDVEGDIGLLVQKVTVGVMNVLQEDRNYSAKWDNSKHMFQKLKMSSERFKAFDQKEYGTIKNGDLRRFQNIPSQYQGKFSQHLPSYDKMSYWSSLVDLLLDISINVKQLTAKEVMGFILFCALETNGTILPVGIISERLKTPEKRERFKNHIIKVGMYYTLLRYAVKGAIHRRTNNYGASTGSRHTHHNRTFFFKENSSVKVSNIAGAPNDCTLDVIYEDYDYDTSNHVFKFAPKSEDNMYDLFMHCEKVEEAAVHLCKKSRNGLFPKKKATKKNESSPQSIEMENLLKAVKEMAGPGVGHIFALNFVQLASCFGFLPPSIMNYSSVASPSSGGYKLIRDLYKKTESVTITPKSAQMLFEGTVSYLRNIFGHAISYPFVENMLCELRRDQSDRKVAVRDYYYFHSHRDNCFHGLQNLVKFSYESGRTMSMELLPLLQSKSIAEDKDDYVGKVMTLFQWNGGSLSGSASQSEIKWKSRSGKNGDPKIDSVMVVSKSLASCFTVLNGVRTEKTTAFKHGLDEKEHLKNQSICNALDLSPSCVSVSSESVKSAPASVDCDSVTCPKKRRNTMISLNPGKRKKAVNEFSIMKQESSHPSAVSIDESNNLGIDITQAGIYL